MRLNDLIENLKIKPTCQIINEKEFQIFSRITSQATESRCVFLSNKRYINKIDQSVSMVITTPAIASDIGSGYGLCITDDPRGLYFELLNEYETSNVVKITPTKMGENCTIGKYTVISEENVEIGEGVCIEDYVKIGPNVIIGNNTHIQAGSQIGIQDFNMYMYQGKAKQVYHGGRTVIGENVIISGNVIIGQALYNYDETKIGDNCIIGAGVLIGHNCKIGNRVRINGGAVVAGYTRIGDDTTIGIGANVKNGTDIGSNVTIDMGSVVIRNVPEGETVFGNPARRIIVPR